MRFNPLACISFLVRHRTLLLMNDDMNTQFLFILLIRFFIGSNISLTWKKMNLQGQGKTKISLRYHIEIYLPCRKWLVQWQPLQETSDLGLARWMIYLLSTLKPYRAKSTYPWHAGQWHPCQNIPNPVHTPAEFQKLSILVFSIKACKNYKWS